MSSNRQVNRLMSVVNVWPYETGRNVASNEWISSKVSHSNLDKWSFIKLEAVITGNIRIAGPDASFFFIG